MWVLVRRHCVCTIGARAGGGDVGGLLPLCPSALCLLPRASCPVCPGCGVVGVAGCGDRRGGVAVLQVGGLVVPVGALVLAGGGRDGPGCGAARAVPGLHRVPEGGRAALGFASRAQPAAGAGSRG